MRRRKLTGGVRPTPALLELNFLFLRDACTAPGVSTLKVIDSTTGAQEERLDHCFGPEMRRTGDPKSEITHAVVPGRLARRECFCKQCISNLRGCVPARMCSRSTTDDQQPLPTIDSIHTKQYSSNSHPSLHVADATHKQPPPGGQQLCPRLLQCLSMPTLTTIW